MKTLPFLLLAVLILATSNATATRNAQRQAASIQSTACECINVKRIRGANCGSRESLKIEFRNECDHAVNAQIYVKWSPDEAQQKVDPPSPMRPGESASYFWCREPYEVVVACE